MLARIHDVLEIDAEQFLQAQSSAPEWVVESLRRTPFVVVRRGPISEWEIPIGVRGAQRNERWAAACPASLINSIQTPQSLRGRKVAAPRDTAIPALRSLPLLIQRWRDLDCSWGPGGSVGFELATGRQIARPQSDLDVVIYARTRMTTNDARSLLDAAQGLPAVVDVRVETPICGFSLVEYASRAPAPILLRAASGAILATDPWSEPGATSTSSAMASSDGGP